jgi:hypothetical protein
MQQLHEHAVRAHPYAGYHFDRRPAVKERFCRLALELGEDEALTALFSAVSASTTPLALLEGQEVPVATFVAVGKRLHQLERGEEVRDYADALAAVQSEAELLALEQRIHTALTGRAAADRAATAAVKEEPRRGPLVDDPTPAPVALFPFRRGERWGYMDSEGHPRIEPQFERAFDFSDGRACVILGGEWHALEDGKTAPLGLDQKDELFAFAEGRAYFRRGSHYGVIDTRGQEIVAPRFRHPARYAFGRVVFDSQHVLDRDGREVFAADSLGPYSQGVAFGHRKKQSGFFDVDGKLVIPAPYPYSTGFHCDRAGINNGAKQGVVDPAMRWVIPFREGQSFHACADGMIAAWNRTSWGYYDRDGALRIPHRYKSALDFSEGLACVTDEHGLHFITTSGDVAIANARFGGAFAHGLLHFVSRGQGTLEEGYMNKEGRIVVSWTSPHTQILI